MTEALLTRQCCRSRSHRCTCLPDVFLFFSQVCWHSALWRLFLSSLFSQLALYKVQVDDAYLKK